MRNLIALVILVTVIAAVGCGDNRQSMAVAPDRGGHAGGDVAKRGGLPMGPPAARKGEIYVTMGPQDSLSSIAKAYGVTLDWLIRRNDLTNPNPKAGTNLVVPNRALGAGAPAPAAPAPAPAAPAPAH